MVSMNHHGHQDLIIQLQPLLQHNADGGVKIVISSSSQAECSILFRFSRTSSNDLVILASSQINIRAHHVAFQRHKEPRECKLVNSRLLDLEHPSSRIHAWGGDGAVRVVDLGLAVVGRGLVAGEGRWTTYVHIDQYCIQLFMRRTYAFY